MRRRLFLLLLLAVACRDGATGPHTEVRVPALPAIDLVSDGLSANLSVPVDSTTRVRVRYAPIDGPGDTLEVIGDVSVRDSTLRLDQLKPGRTYAITAVAVAPDGALGPPSSSQFTTAALPADLAHFGVAVDGAPLVDLVMFEVRAASGFQGFVAVDHYGEVVWYYRTTGAAQGATRLPNGNFVLLDNVAGLREVDPSGHVVHALDAGALPESPHHDVLALSDTAVLFITKDRQLHNGVSIALDAIWEWNPLTGATRKRWSAWDAYDPSAVRGPRSIPADWLHANAIARGPRGNILLSLTWIHQVISIAPDFTSIEWRLGGPGSDFSFVGDAEFNGQHAAGMTGDGRVLLFDNGRDRADGSQWSRGLELDLDPIAHQASTRWQFRPSPDIYAPFLGYVARLDNGNTWTHFGLAAGPFNDKIATGPIVGIEVTPSGTPLGAYRLTNSLSAYRSWPLDHIGDAHRTTAPSP